LNTPSFEERKDNPRKNLLTLKVEFSRKLEKKEIRHEKSNFVFSSEQSLVSHEIWLST
jgi:hypothetical protein